MHAVVVGAGSAGSAVAGRHAERGHTVTLVEAASGRVSIFGQVQKAGTIPFVAGMTIVDAVAQAGGFSPMAKKNAVQVTRAVDGRKQTFTLPVEDIGEGSRPNFLIQPGDVVFVPERLF